jgi:catechol 2,3-dioxygenase-like lactoylglutathione lyase family enzyme
MLAQVKPPAPIRVHGISQIRLTVGDVGRSLDFCQGLFGMPVQARQGATVLLRIGDGPRFLCLQQARKGEAPRISALGFSVEDLSVDRAMQTLAAHGITAAPPTADTPGRGKRWFAPAGRTKAALRMAAHASFSSPIRAV